ncbi:ScyD/ScyE family protein [Ornithinimicrobium sp. F0845]|uniref:ScyD/ScyE family protein n=1 Tax=Ornithinimicrobium sp. F0845 TaxID=2926412 RepID=UPI001FF448AE|nr:ScyD/ScyE family protein [Ornithinimicrobium sp. F0845]MCK0113468.1 ScyD/ScyE family protein [Ornithinimicrobium sp. F0845]
MTSRPLRALGVATAACLVTTALTAPSVAGVSQGRHDRPAEGKVVASGLNSPRHLTVASNGDLYVAEAGTGGDDCVVLGDDGAPVFDGDVLLECGTWDPEEHPMWGEVRLGDTGSITKVSRKGGQRQVVTGLPSIDLGGGEGTGPSDVAVRGNKLMITVGMGAPPEMRDLMVELFDDDTYEDFATVQQASFRGKHRVSLREVADLAQFEADVNPHPDFLDTNPNAIVRDGSGWLLTDAGGNSVIRLSKRGNLSTVAVPPGGMAEAPPFLELPPGTMIPFEPVPTAAERGPDGAIYVSLLTGFPFPVGGSSIWRIARDGSMTEWATGLTNVTDLTWAKGKLYAVQLADNGLLSGDMTGSLVRVREGSDAPTVIADGLFAPYGVAVHKNSAYVTTGTVVPGGGEVVRFDVRRRY